MYCSCGLCTVASAPVKFNAFVSNRIQSLQEQNRDIVSERLRIEDELDDIASTNEHLKEKVEDVQRRCKELGQRASTLLYQIEAQSPVLSQAEEWMRDEVDGINSHMPLLLQKLHEVLCVL